MRILVMAKAPVAGSVKTRLCPPCTHTEAATVAAAALDDTLDAALATGGEVVVALAGPRHAWRAPRGVQVIGQQGSTFNERLAYAWRAMRGGAVQIGMDTPQVDAPLLVGAWEASRRHGAALGLATDGGWWALALRAPVPGAFDGVEMSTATTGARQRARLADLGVAPTSLPTLTDVDEWSDAVAVAAASPRTRFADAVHAIATRHASVGR
jgi:glycosyltransferase A (GT-A) superfamily protein (DUF2064 family)